MMVVIQIGDAFSSIRFAVLMRLSTFPVSMIVMLVMPQMARLARGALMLAIGHCCRPNGLQRHQNQQEDREPSTHFKSISGSRRRMFGKQSNNR